MKLTIAKKLHNEDEVIDKRTGESVIVLSIRHMFNTIFLKKMVVIEGIGAQKGYGEWIHTDVK